MATGAHACYHRRQRGGEKTRGEDTGTDGIRSPGTESEHFSMVTTMSGSRRAAVLTALLLLHGHAAGAQEKTPLPPFTGERVIVKGVDDRFQDARTHIARLEKSSPQTYYVVVVKSTGRGASATAKYIDELRDSWLGQKDKNGQSFDPDRSVLIVVAIDTHQVALLPGVTLRKKFGLVPAVVEGELIPAFLKLRVERKYPEAVVALLNATNDWIAQKDTSTAPAEVNRAQSTAPEPVKRASTAWWAVVVLWIPILALGVAVFAWVWILHRRAQSRVAARVKEVKSKAVDVMDRLDSLKERLKLLPASTDFKQPLAGETKSLLDAANGRLDVLWDGWLEVMEVLDKAQKLAARSGSPLSQKTLAEAEDLITKQGSFEEIEKQAQAIAADVDHLDHAHQAAREALSALAADRPKIDAALAEVGKLGLAQTPYQESLSEIAAQTNQANTVLVADPLGTAVSIQQIRSRSEDLLRRVERVVSLFGEARKIQTAVDTLKAPGRGPPGPRLEAGRRGRQSRSGARDGGRGANGDSGRARGR